MALCLHAGNPSGFYLHNGDTVVFYGDSITNQRFYTTFVETFVLTRFPQLDVRFVNSGWDGDRTSGGGGGPIDLRLRRDILAYHPSVVTVMLGMNDGEYQPFSAEIFEKYAAGYRHILDTLHAQAPGLRITLLEPSPYDDVTRPPRFPGGYNAVLLRYGEFLRGLANSRHLAIADLNAPAVATLDCVAKTNRDFAPNLITDRVHPSQGIHLVMAEALLKAWRAPAIVTAVELDAASGAATRQTNTTVEALDASAAGLAWTQRDAALPMPVEMEQESIAAALPCSDITEALNQQPLKVTGLNPGRYTLKIDDEATGSFTAAELAQGINLAMLPTPMARQAAAVRTLTFRRNHVHFARWRYVEVSLEEYHPAKLPQAVAALDALDSELAELQKSTVQPKPHRYQLTAATR